MRIRNRFLSICIAFLLATVTRAQQIVISPDHTNGIYQVGDVVHWRAEWQGSNSAPVAHYILKRGGLANIGHGEFSFSNNIASIETKLDAPGTMLVESTWKNGADREGKALGGAVAAPERITRSAPKPRDFDAFWRSKLKELEAVPTNTRLESAESGKANVAYWKITMNNIRGTHIHGQIARPANGRKFPALLIVQWAGVYPLQKNWATDRAAEGWLTLDIEAHDLPIDQPEAFYKEQFDGPLKDYWSIGNTNRDTSYFLRMYLSCYRAAEYLSNRPDWDGKTLVVMGGSQGGQQALMTAALFPRFTAALAEVPAGCDMLGPNVGRAPGWPHWYFNTEGGKDPHLVREASRYYDIANFTPRIKCPVLVGLGLIDEVCPPAGVLAAINQIRSPKEVIILPKAGHQDEHDSHRAYLRRCYSEWLPTMQKGEPAPVRP